MKIQNLIIFKNKNTAVKLCTLSLTGVIILTSLSACNKKVEQHKTNNTVQSGHHETIINDNQQNEIKTDMEQFRISQEEAHEVGKKYAIDIKVFDAGEHTVSLHFQSKEDFNNKWKGYECINVIEDSSGFLVTFKNIEPVECLSYSKDDNGNFEYTSIGLPVSLEKIKIK